jgi:hypothetical protein
MPATTGWRGRSRRYSDIAIEAGLMLRLAFGRPWRQTEGMLGSIMDLLGLDLAVLDHTTFSRRSVGPGVATALGFHSNLADQNQFIHFFKNISMAGGLLQVVAFGASRLSLDAWRR